MPTGYTAAVEDGKITELKPFALRCARAFGALVSMREDGLDAPIPEKVDSLNYYTHESSRLASELAALEAMTLEECAAAQDAEIAKEQQTVDAYVAENALRNGRYAAMDEKVRAWDPPPVLEGLRAFMLQQLSISKHDTYEHEVSERIAPEAWRGSRVGVLRRRLANIQANVDREAKQLQEANDWLAALHAAF